MEIFGTIAIIAIVWVLTIATMVILLFKNHIPSEEHNMAFYLVLQAAIPVAIFWWLQH